MWIEVKAALSTSPEHLRKFGVSATKEDAEALMVISEGGVGESYGYECLRWNVGRVFGEGEWVVFYKDDEGDWIGMSSQEEFLEGVRCKGTGALRVMVERGKKVEAVTEVVPVVETEQNTLEPVPMPTKHAQVTFAPLLIDTEDTLLSDSALEPGFQHSPVLDDAPPLPPRSMEQESLPTPVYSEETPPVYDESRSVPVDDEKAPVVTSTINELQYYRLIIQTAISEGVRNLFETQDPSHPNNLDYAINEIMYGRTVLISAVEDVLFNRTPQPHASSSSSTFNPGEWMDRHRPAVDAFVETVRGTVNSAKDSANKVAETVLAHRITQATQLLAEDMRDYVKTALKPSGGVDGERVVGAWPEGVREVEEEVRGRRRRGGSPKRAIEDGLKFVVGVMGSVVLGAGKLLVDVGARMVREEPFSGMSDMPVYGEEGEEEELVKRRGREVVVEEEVVTEEEVTREDEVEVQPVVIFDAPVVDLAPVVEDLPVFEDAPVLEDAPLGEDAPVMGDAPILEVISDESDTDDTPQSLYSSAADGIIQMESVPLHTSSPGTFSSEILALLRSPEIVPVTVVNGDDGEVSEDDGKVEREVERKEEDDFVIVEEDEDLGLKSSTLVFPVQQ